MLSLVSTGESFTVLYNHSACTLSELGGREDPQALQHQQRALGVLEDYRGCDPYFSKLSASQRGLVQTDWVTSHQAEN